MIAIGTVLSFFLRPTSFLAPLAAAGLALVVGFGSGYVKGFSTAVASYKVASLQQQVEELRQAAEKSERISGESAALAAKYEAEGDALRTQISEIANAQPPGDVCRLDGRRLQQLRAIAAKVG